MPSPASCAALLAAAQAYLLRQVAHWSPAYVRLVRARPAVQCSENAIDAACLAGDAEALKAACRRWWASVLYV